MRVLGVSQALSYVRELLETDLVLSDVWLSGEVSGPRTQPSGHTYFVLKDESSQLRGVLFRATQQRQRRVVEYLTHGAQVIVHGRFAVYESRGELQIVVDFVQPEGAGLRNAQFERLRQQLDEEGLFELSRKRPLPRFPSRIGIVTSPSGAVFHDVCNILTRRWPLAEVVLAPTPVQGPEAQYGVVGGIEALNHRGDIDVIIVARGGGSIEELWAFNEESVARAVFGSLVPVVSAVGHETDFTICDYVADVRAPTPSAAAELIAPDREQLSHLLSSRLASGLGFLARAVDRDSRAVSGLMQRAGRSSADVERWQQRILDLERRATVMVTNGLRHSQNDLRRCLAQLTALDPQATLNRGYAVVHRADRVVTSISEVHTGDGLVVKVADGGFTARVAGAGQKRPRLPARTRLPASTEPMVQPLLIP